MGAADIVPGVSGGTVALVLGVYTRLITALNNVDRRLLSLVSRAQWRPAAQRIDLKFLLLLGGGIVASVLLLSRVIHHLLEHHRDITYAAFFGLIAASGLIVGRMIKPDSTSGVARLVVIGVLAAGFAAWLSGLTQLAPREGLPYTFCCGCIAICAMILPGISGAYLLLMLGKYEEITDILRRLPKLDIGGHELLTVGVFAIGCLVGLLAFSRLLRWLLDHYWSATMAVLCGFMIGSLRRVWPFQQDTTPDVEKFKLKIFEPYWPEAWGSEELMCVGVAIAGFAIVLIVDAMASRKQAQRPTTAVR